jgi:hypothetical protein
MMIQCRHPQYFTTYHTTHQNLHVQIMTVLANRCMEMVLKQYQACPICREPDSGRPLRVSTVLRDAINKLFPKIHSLNSEKTLSTRELIVEKFSSPEQRSSAVWFADFSLSLAASRAEVISGSSAAALQAGNAEPDAILESTLQRLLRRAGCLGECKEVYEELRSAIDLVLDRIISVIPHASISTPHGVVCDDVLASLSKLRHFPGVRMHPSSIYGFGGTRCFRYIWTRYIQKTMKQVHPGLRLGGGAASVICDMLSEALHTLLVLTAEFADPFLNAMCQEEMEFAAGPELDTGDLDPTYKVKIYVAEDGVYVAEAEDAEIDVAEDADIYVAEDAEARAPVPGPKVVLTVADTQRALVALPGELMIHARSEGTKAVLKFRDSTLRYVLLHKKSGTQFHPEHIALFAQRTAVPVPSLDIEACVFLAAVVEYLCAEIVEVGTMLCFHLFHLQLIGCCCSYQGILPRTTQLLPSKSDMSHWAFDRTTSSALCSQVTFATEGRSPTSTRLSKKPPKALLCPRQPSTGALLLWCSLRPAASMGLAWG